WIVGFIPPDEITSELWCGDGHATRRINIRVCGVIFSSVLAGPTSESVWLLELDRVFGARLKIGECVVTVLIGGSCPYHLTTIVVKRYGHTAHRNFIGILNAVSILVPPNVVADGHSAND